MTIVSDADVRDGQQCIEGMDVTVERGVRRVRPERFGACRGRE
ncbi:hypothetical protein [Halorubrum sp. Eb13]|nr:hypothetical protein [Halorubrum sp. Eb13]